MISTLIFAVILIALAFEVGMLFSSANPFGVISAAVIGLLIGVAFGYDAFAAHDYIVAGLTLLSATAGSISFYFLPETNRLKQVTRAFNFLHIEVKKDEAKTEVKNS